VDNYHSLSVHQKAQFSILFKTSIFNSESLPSRFLTMSAATLATALIYISSALLTNLAYRRRIFALVWALKAVGQGFAGMSSTHTSMVRLCDLGAGFGLSLHLSPSYDSLARLSCFW
jgi:hypothetical protein